MRPDTRANLIFLAVFAALSAPGVVIVVRKAMNGESRALRAMEPPAVRNSLAYMDPTLAVGAHDAYAPPITASLVERLRTRLIAMQPGLAANVDGRPLDRVMSDRFSLQLLAAGAHDGKYNVALLGWSGDYHPLPTLYAITGMRADGVGVAGSLDAFEEQNMPLEVRSELQDAGWIRPPDGLMWMIVSFPGEAAVDAVRVRYAFETKTIDDTLRVARPTAAATRP